MMFFYFLALPCYLFWIKEKSVGRLKEPPGRDGVCVSYLDDHERAVFGETWRWNIGDGRETNVKCAGEKSKREREEIRRGRAEALTRRPTVNYGASEREHDDRPFVCSSAEFSLSGSASFIHQANSTTSQKKIVLRILSSTEIRETYALIHMNRSLSSRARVAFVSFRADLKFPPLSDDVEI